ncbi:NUDIX domain-containing protein [Rubrolithibacter danxiaensis]|uniref:NUDIX domain-containing protein n=1 Tax=Rubrolithibacter danxiaensis TaxID=3390805 RepID=UPI003BF89EFB
MSEIQILKTEVLSDLRSKLEKITYQTVSNTGTQEHEREVFHRPDATVILLYDPSKKKVLLTEQFRLPVYLKEKHTKLLEACAGLIDEGEFPEHAVIREVEEETGYRISQIKKIAEAYSSPGSFTELVHYFVGEYNEELKVSEGGGLKDEGEDIHTVELSFQEARQLLADSKIHDAKTIILLQYAIINNII